MLRPLRCMLFATGVALVVVSLAQAAPIGTLKQFKIPTANGNPKAITPGADGNFWFTESHVEPPQSDNHHVGRITPSGDITEFLVCSFCFPNDIVQGPNGVLYFTKSDPGLGRITTSGTVLPDVVPPNTLANGNGVAASGNGIYFAAFNTNSIWRYDAVTDAFTEFPIPTAASSPSDVATAGDGSIWFSEAGADKLGRLDPATGAITEFSLGGDPNGPTSVTVATDGKVWFTKRFTHVVGYLEPASGAVTVFSLTSPNGPQGIAAAADGSVWVTQTLAGNVVRITASGVISEGKRVKGSEPFGVTVAANGDPWYAMLAADKIATLQLR
jgi:virginiamycin B lyase